MKLNRAMLYLHLKKLEEAKLIFGELKMSSDGKALKYDYLKNFSILIDHDLVEKCKYLKGVS